MDIGIGEDEDRGAGILFDDEDLFGKKVGATTGGINKKKGFANDDQLCLDDLGIGDER